MTQEHDKIGDLIRHAGAREVVAPLAHERAKREVRKAFDDALAKRKFRRRQTIGIAATALLGLALWLGLGLPKEAPVGLATQLSAAVERLSGTPRVNGNRLLPETQFHAGDVIETGSSGTLTLRMGPARTVRLDHGTRLHILSGSELTLDSGRLYVDAGSTNLARAPLSIDTALGTAREIGTQFSLQVAAQELYVRVREGRVDLIRAQQRHTATALVQLHATADSSDVERVTIGIDDDLWGWAEALAPAFDINDISLHAYLGWVARETGRHLIYRERAAQTAAQTVRLRGNIDQLTPEQSLAAVIPTTALAQNISVTPTQIVVTSESPQ
ncbi:MAG: FecR family protein [Gammaproteobacteria bacterium]